MLNNWQEIKLGDISTFHKGKGLPKSSIVKDGQYECVHYGELFTKYSERIRHIISKTNKDDNVFISRENDILMPTSDVTPRGLSTASYLGVPGVILGGDILIIRADPEKLYGPYFAYFVSTNKHKIIRLVSGSTVFHLYGSDVARLKMLLPDVAEQKRIIVVIESWDEYIGKLEDKIELKKNIKKGLMQQLLTSNESWKKSTVSEVFSFIPTGSHSKETMTYSDTSNKPLNIHYGDIHTKYQDYIDFHSHRGIPHLTSDEVSQRMLLQDGDLVVADASEDYDGVGACVELKNLGDRKCIAGLHTFALRPKNGLIAPGFAKLIFKEPKTANWLKRVSTYSKVYGLSKFNFSKTEVYLPPYEEQQKIVYILDAMALEINLLEKKRVYLEEQKKYLANNLISGKIRTPENLTMPAKEVQYA